MNEIDEIYTDLIMEHSVNSVNKKELLCPSCSMYGKNPNCGDEIKLELVLDGDKIVDLAFNGHGCAISQSSTSIMIDTLKGKTIEQAKQIIALFIKMIKREKLSQQEKDMLENSVAFENISNMPARVKCALLSWYTMQDMLDKKSV